MCYLGRNVSNLDYVGPAGGYASWTFAQPGKRMAYIRSAGDDHNGRPVRDTLARDGISPGCSTAR